MDISFTAKYENDAEHKFTVHINTEKGQTITDAVIKAARVAGTLSDSPIVNIHREEVINL